MNIGPIRDAVAAGEYPKAAELFAEYARTAHPDEETLGEARELLRWTRLTVRCAIAREHSRLQALRDDAYVLGAYVRPGDGQ